MFVISKLEKLWIITLAFATLIGIELYIERNFTAQSYCIDFDIDTAIIHSIAVIDLVLLLCVIRNETVKHITKLILYVEIFFTIYTGSVYVFTPRIIHYALSILGAYYIIRCIEELSGYHPSGNIFIKSQYTKNILFINIILAVLSIIVNKCTLSVISLLILSMFYFKYKDELWDENTLNILLIINMFGLFKCIIPVPICEIIQLIVSLILIIKNVINGYNIISFIPCLLSIISVLNIYYLHNLELVIYCFIVFVFKIYKNLNTVNNKQLYKQT